MTDEQGTANLLEVIAHYAAMTPEQTAEELAKVRAEMAELEEQDRLAELERRQQTAESPLHEPEPSDSLPEAPERAPRPVVLPTYEDAPDAWNPWMRIER